MRKVERICTVCNGPIVRHGAICAHTRTVAIERNRRITHTLSGTAVRASRRGSEARARAGRAWKFILSTAEAAAGRIGMVEIPSLACIAGL
jgi:hypothetical protein